MKKMIATVMAVCFVSSALVSCGGGTTVSDTTGTPGEGSDTTASVTTEYDYTKIPEVVEPHEKKKISADDIGFASVLTKSEKSWVADAKVDREGNVTVTSYNPGTTVITLTNSYSHKRIAFLVAVQLEFQSLRAL